MHTIEAEIKDSALVPIAEKVAAGERLTQSDGEALYASSDLIAIGRMADTIKRAKTGNDVFFVVNRHINHTNVCDNRCKFCAFSRDADADDAYTMTLEQVFAAAESSKPLGISELHIVGGLHPDLPWQYYLDMMSGLKEIMPDVHIQAFTAVEIDHFAKISGLSIEEVLRQLRDAGLGSLPGGGAEIFSERTRADAWEKKIPADEWLGIMRTAHKLGIRSNATMLYGHIETIPERIDHLIRLRELQDETGGFAAFIPLAFHPTNTEMSSLAPTTGYDDLKTLAIARLILDNFDHIKAFWIMVGPKLAQVSLAFGVDDIDGTVVEEKITHFAGAETPEYIRKEDLVKLVAETGNVAVERDTLYNVIRRYE